MTINVACYEIPLFPLRESQDFHDIPWGDWRERTEIDVTGFNF